MEKEQEAEPKQKSIAGLLKSFTRRRSMVVPKVSKKSPREEAIQSSPSLSRRSTAGSLRTERKRAGTAGQLGSQSADQIQKLREKEEYNHNPEKVEDFPPSIRDWLKDTTASSQQIADHWSVVIDALRISVPRDMRHYSFLKAPKSSNQTVEVEESGEGLYITVQTEKMLKKQSLSIREQIGQGSFGSVYDAKHKGLHVAVKKISHIGKRHIRRNNCEVKYLLLCKHVNIMTVHCCYHTLDSDNIWLVMELLEGGSLDEAINLSGPIPEKESCRCGSDLLSALVYLHSKGFCHRDLKPANAMLAIEQKAKRARVKLVDFSLCSDLSTGPVVHSMGTPGYMPPEMTLRQPHHFSSDIWSLGIFVATLLDGKCPNDHSRFDAHFLPAIGIPPKLTKENFSSEAHDFVAACLVCDPANRPAAESLVGHPWLKKAASMEQMWRLVKTVFRVSAINNVIGVL